MNNRQETKFALYDSRYLFDPDRAILYETCDTIEEAIKDKNESFKDAIIVKETWIIRIIDGKKTFEVVNCDIIDD